MASVCHIYAAEENGPRQNNGFTPEQKRSADNLILLCKICHEIVDSDEKKYPAELLKDWKRNREKVFSEIGNTLKKSYLDQITDERDQVDFRPLNNLCRYAEYLDRNNCSHHIDEDELKKINTYVESLRHLTLNDRSFLVKVVETALSIPSARESDCGLDIHPDDLKVLRVDGKPLSAYRIKNFANTLERHGLGFLDPECSLELRVSCPIYYLGWSDLVNFGKENGKTLNQYICELDFTDLDDSNDFDG